MALQNITEPVLTDSTGQDIVEALGGIKNAVQPINIYLDIPITIPVSGWSDGTPHQYIWTNARVTTECGIEVFFTEGAETVDMKYIEYEKILGGIQFEINELPDKAIPMMVRIINASTTGVIEPIDASLVTEEAVPNTATVEEALENHEDRISSAESAIDDLEDGVSDLNDEMALRLKSVNGVPGDENGNVTVNETEFAHQIVTDDAQHSTGEFVYRTTGGDASLSDGPAMLVAIDGRSVHTGEVADSLSMVVNAVTRTATSDITAVFDKDTFLAYVAEAGVYTLLYTTDWNEDPALYGVTVSNTPEYGDRISIEWDGVTDPSMTVVSNHVAPPAITATINRVTFEAYVAGSGTYTLTYTSSWSEDPALYGVTVVNTPVSGDEIVITYVQSDRGMITVSTPTSFVSTGWNLYNNATGKKYARVVKYSDQYGFIVGGAYAGLEFSTTVTGTRTTITPASGYFAVPSDGYVFVTGGDATTYVMMTWSDWTEGYEGDFETYSETTVDLTSIMTYFPYGLCQVGAVSDEINFSMKRAISRIDRLAYSASNLASVKASGRPYDADTNYIYVVKETEDVYTFDVSGAYTASDHGCEFVTGSDVSVYVETLYGRNLVDYLRHDIPTQLTQHSQSITSNTQAIANLPITYLGSVSSLPTLNPTKDGNIGFTFANSITLDNVTIPAGTRFVGIIQSNIAHVEGVSPSGDMYLLRYVPTGNKWSFLSQLATKSEISAYLKSGTNYIGNIILPGYITGSGNYIDAFLPLDTCGKTVTSISALSDTKVFTIDEIVSYSSVPIITLVERTNFGLRLEITLPSTKTANRTATIYLVGLTVVCS